MQKKKRQLFNSQLHILTGANLKQRQLAAAAHPICVNQLSIRSMIAPLFGMNFLTLLILYIQSFQ